MILLLSPYQNAHECAALIERATRDKVKHVPSIGLALAALRSESFEFVVADENLLESTPQSLQSLTQRMETAMPIVADLACLRPEKVANLVAATVKRQQLQFQLAREKALAELRSEMKSEVTGLLISSELVLKSSGLPAKTREKVSAVIEIAQRMKSRLGREQ
jgi:hypothetical protein